ncbi:SusC/RagA family TonB-linked outer membrane protein [Spirosoma utsteinense]|uniref:TonB-linked SusC/RagA family outer membrane protein n=1 Tax=Spirosoma utsteinense TaxID=2585773 RepID=A0ABR6W1E4_9BACT|nr:SusC/RagA family TonB-linked outer membrane protein [Spirosoma utsteinense]MBC3784961.1 TonB-linked SusC/RagA family outer membrane protein [Spirosoma utsteinense]MBC3790431.1 TonB-linked SusC/RagA family outer membrane protein [Spirosoma utsteinense]
MRHFVRRQVCSLGTLLWALFLLAGSAQAQDRRVTGRVLSGKDQQPIPGVNVLIKSTQTGTTTDANGNFTLNASPNATLVFSAIGFQGREVTIGNQSQVNVSLQEGEQNLNEVVVTALGIKKEAKRLGYATAIVNPEQVTTNRTVNFINALQGKIAGVNISSLGTGAAGTSKIRIRGQSSFSGQNSPLIVINGVPIDNTNFGQNNGNNGGDNSVGNRDRNYSDGGDGLSSINPDDIEGMTVLKGGTAAALYGSRAKDGAILITTKTKGAGQGIGVTYNTNFTSDRPLDFTDYQYEYGQGEYGVRPQAANPTSGVWSFGEKFAGQTQVLFGGLTVPYQPVRNRINTFYRDGSTWTNSIAVSSGSEKGGFNLSLSNMDNKGITPNNSFSRKTINLGFSYNLSPKLTVTGTMNYSYELNKNPPQIAQQDNSTPTVLYTLANSMPLDVLQANQINPTTGNEFIYSRFMNRTNPYFVLNNKFETIRRDRLFGNISARYNFTDWLYLQGRVGQDYWSRDQDYNFPTGQASLAAAPAGFVNGAYVQDARRFRELNTDFLIGANRKFGVFGVDLTLGGNQLYRRSDLNSVQVTDFIVRGLYVPQNGRVKDPLYGLSERKVNSLYGALELAYKDFLFLNGTVRNDWFSTLAPANRSIVYPSLTGSFVFSQAFNSLPSFINFGKLRAAYAEVGSDGDVAPYSNNLFYGVSANLFPNPAGQGQPVGTITSNTVPSATLKPSRTAETEVGLELKMFNSRVGLDVAVYSKITSDQIVQAQSSDASGYTSTLINSGQSRNQGIEILLNLSPVRTQNFSWDVTLNGSYNKTKLLKLLTNDDGSPERDYNKDKQAEQIVVGTGIYVGDLRQVVGQELGQLYSFGYQRDAQGRIIHGGDGLPLRTAAPVSFGSALPKYLGGITNTFNYKGLNLSVLVDFKLGGKMISGTNLNAFRHGLQKETLVGRGEADNKMLGVGVNEKGEANAVRAFVQDYYSVGRSKSLGEQVVYDAGLWKLRQISLGYDFTKLLPQSLFIKGVRLSAVANNVAILKKWVPNIDPEQFGFSSDNLVGLESTGLPTTRSIGFNLNVKF